MEGIDLIKICREVLLHLSKMGYEVRIGSSSGQLIFPKKIQANGDKDRISEQELRLLFIEEFKKNYESLFYSIETPTFVKYNFGKHYEDIRPDKNGQSASLDMCIFKRNSDSYERILNIEFKSKNPPIKHFAKDILKLMHEKQNGAFIHLLESSGPKTFCNDTITDRGIGTGVFNKYYDSFTKFQANWTHEKSIHFIIISLRQNTILHREIKKQDLNNLKDIFFIETSCGNITDIKGNDWINELILNKEIQNTIVNSNVTLVPAREEN